MESAWLDHSVGCDDTGTATGQTRGPMTDRLFDLPVTMVSEWIFNSYAIMTDSGGLVVVDPGLPTVATKMLAKLSRGVGAGRADISTVLCTHGHSDHVGGVSTLLRGCGAEVHLPQRCESYLAGEIPRVFPVVESSLRFMPVYREQPFSVRGVREFLGGAGRIGYGSGGAIRLDFAPTGYLADGDGVPGAPGWTVIHAPGHTDDSTCFHHGGSGTLISGDAVVTQDGTAWFNPEYVDLATARTTVERLKELDVRHLLPGHGMPIGGADIWDRARHPGDRPTGASVLARCSRRFARWPG